MDAQLHQFGYGPVSDEEQQAQRGTSLPRMAVRGAAGGALAGGAYAAYKNRDAVKGAARTGIKQVAKKTGWASNQLHKQAMAGSGVGMKAASAGSELLRKTTSGLRKVAKSFADVDGIIELAERIADLELEHEFAGVDQFRQANGVRYADPSKPVKSLNKMKGGLVGAVKRNPKAAGAIGGAALVGGALVKRAHDKSKRRDELLSRFKGGAEKC